jgi:hypothetical protein
MKPARKDRICPLCGRPNRCGETDPAIPNGGCWCFHRYFPPELLARVPKTYRRSPCICHDCLAEFLGQQSPSGHPDTRASTRSEPQLGAPCEAAFAFEINDEDRVSHAPQRTDGTLHTDTPQRNAGAPHILSVSTAQNPSRAIRHLTQHGGNGVHPKLT